MADPTLLTREEIAEIERKHRCGDGYRCLICDSYPCRMQRALVTARAYHDLVERIEKLHQSWDGVDESWVHTFRKELRALLPKEPTE